MLIASDRHKPDDLQLWRDFAEADIARATMLRQKQDHALSVIRDFISGGRCYVGVSGGKDSTVVAHLVSLCNVSIPLARVKIMPIANPDSDRVLEALVSLTHQTLITVEVWCRRDDHGWHAPGTLEIGFDLIAERLKTRRHLSGVRGDESGVRKITMRRNGEASIGSCRPIGWWTNQEVFGHLAAYNLPVHPAYAMMGGGRWPRDRLRVDHLGLRAAEQFGRTDWEREYYGDVLRRLEAARG